MNARTERSQVFLRDALDGTRFANVRWVAETGSTNADLLAAADRGEGEQVLIADLQTAGRGRRDRVWDAPPESGLLMSALLHNVEFEDGFWTVGAMALAASEAIDALTVDPCRLKWPNDLLIGDPAVERKVAGVLAQVAGDAVIVGIGINVNWPLDATENMRERGTAVNRHVSQTDGPEPLLDRAALAADILTRAIGHLDLDRASLCDAWKAQCSTLGRQVELTLQDRSVIGIARDIAPDGALQIEDDRGASFHQFGDVVHLRPK